MLAVGEGEHVLVQIGFVEVQAVAFFELTADSVMAQAQLLAKGPYRQLGGADRVRTRDGQVAIKCQWYARRTADGILKSGIAAGVPARIEVGKAINRLCVVHRITQQVSDAEIHTAASGEDFLADRAGHGVGVLPCAFFGKGDADLHRPAGVYRVQAAKQVFAQWHHADEIIKNGAQLALGAGRIQALIVGFTVGRSDAQGTAHYKLGDMQLAGAAVDFTAGDLAQPRHRRVGLKGRFLLGHSQHGTQVFIGGRQALGSECDLDIRCPAGAVRNLGR